MISTCSEALVQGRDGLSYNSRILQMWKIKQTKKMCPLFWCQKFYIVPLINYLLQNVTEGSLVYSQATVCDAVIYVWLSQ